MDDSMLIPERGVPLPMFQKSSGLPAGASIRNTFLEFVDENLLPSEEDDPWVITPDAKRLFTDSVITDRQFRRHLEQSVLHASTQRTATSSSSTMTEEGQKLAEVLSQLEVQSTQAFVESSLSELLDGEADGEEDELHQEATSSPKQVSPEILAAREVAAAGGGLCGFTTIMMRNVPSKYSQQKLMREINSNGYLGKYDFFYLPVQPHGRGNRGFAFVNFYTPEVAEAFYFSMNGQTLRHFNAEIPVSVLPADLQGFDRNAEHYATMRLNRSRRPLQSGRALFFRPLPPHLLEVAGPAIAVVDPREEFNSWQLGHQVYDESEGSWHTASAGFGRSTSINSAFGMQNVFPPGPLSVSDGNSMNGFDDYSGSADQKFRKARNQKQRTHQASRQGQWSSHGHQASRQGQWSSHGQVWNVAGAPVQRFCAYCGKAKAAEHNYCAFCGQKAPPPMNR